MLNKVVLFLVINIFWNLSLFFLNEISIINSLIGIFSSFIIIYFLYTSNLYSKDTEFLILQFSFYKYIVISVFSSFHKVIQLSFDALNPDVKFKPILDYIFLNKDSNSKAVLTSNILSLTPGVIGILLKKRYLIVHSLSVLYFLPKDLYKISVSIEELDSDSLV